MQAWEPVGQRANRRAELALNDFLQLGSGRSLEKLLARYQAVGSAAPTRRAQTLRDWALRFDWSGRAEYHDELQRSSSQRAESERQAQVLHAGLAVCTERVENLKLLYEQLNEYLRQAWPVWLTDLQNASLEGAVTERSRAPRFNTSVIIQMRGIMEDLARETGGRLPRAQGGGQPEPEPDDNSFPDLRSLSAQQLEALDTILQQAKPLGQPAATWQPGLPGLIK